VLNESTGRYSVTKQSFDDFRNAYMHQRVDLGTNDKGKPVSMPLGELVAASRAPPPVFQDCLRARTRRPRRVQPLARLRVPRAARDCSLYLTHLRENICKGEEAHYNYLIRWMARAVQKPAKSAYRCRAARRARHRQGHRDQRPSGGYSVVTSCT
jgi:hypothetical protein